MTKERSVIPEKRDQSSADVYATKGPADQETIGPGPQSLSDPAATVSSSMLIAAGQRLDTYELLEKLGEGGMGAVWKARHVKLDKLVALKLLPPHLTSDPETVRRFEREMRAVGKVEHPNVVRAMDAGEVGGLHYLVMEYVDGIDLSKYVKQRGPRSISDACIMVRQAALGLAAAHSQGLIHRDIKPSNLLLSRHGQVKVLDLGLARLLADGAEGHELTQLGEVFGTPDFMAPEQWDDSHNVDYRADIYALGCTLCFLLTGRAPFGDDRHVTMTQKMKAHVMEAPPRLRDLRADVSDELDQLYSQLMEKEVKQRLGSAAEVADRLKQIVQGLSTIRSASRDTDTAAMSRTTTADTTDAATPPTLAPTSSEVVASSAAAKPVDLPVEPQTQAAAAPPRARVPKWILAAAGGAMGLVLLGVIIIKVVNKDGSTTELRVPDNAAVVEVEKDGKAIGKLDVAKGMSPAPNSTAALSSTTKNSSDVTADQRAAEWLLSIKAALGVRGKDGAVREIKTAADLPAEAYEVVWVSLQGAAESVTDEGLANLRGLVGLDYLNLIGCGKVTDAGITHLADCVALQELRLDHIPITDRSIASFLKMSNLRRLGLSETLVGDQGIAQLRRLVNIELIHTGPMTTEVGLAYLTAFPKLWGLGIKGHQATEAGASQLSKIKGLRDLYFVGATDESLKRISTLSGIQALNLNMNAVTAAGLDCIKSLPNLETLSLCNSSTVTDDHLADASRFAQVRFLEVHNTSISDAGLASLKTLTRLRRLNVTGTKVTGVGIDELHQALPGCEIFWDGGVIAAETQEAKVE